MLPDMDGLDVCRTLRAAGNVACVLMLTARDARQDKVDGLRVGADDYLTKPFAFDELLARMQALLRRGRYQAATAPVLRVGDLTLDPASRKRSEERRVGKEGVRTCRSRWSPYH